ncbi:MAG: carbon storage regulator CsrA [Candidatus Hydrogenedentota bacterium]
MLILTRKPEESIMIGDDVEVKVLDIHDNKVRLGISAPKDVVVHRREVYQEIKRENVEASAPPTLEGLDSVFAREAHRSDNTSGAEQLNQ